MTKTIYINRKDSYGNFETVDEFTDLNSSLFRKYVNEMLNYYRLSDKPAHYYKSQKCCKDWKITGGE